MTIRKPRNQSVRGSRAKHLKEVGLNDTTVVRYRKAINRFFQYMHQHHRLFPSSVPELDYEVSEFINHLWQDDFPESYATDLHSGLSRFLPHCRRKMPISSSYLSNWRKNILRNRAFPFTGLMVRGLAGVAYSINRPDLAAVLLVGFVALLRTSEMTNLKFSDVIWLDSGRKAILMLPSTKSGSRLSIVEKVIVTDTYVLKALHLARLFAAGATTVYSHGPQKFNAELRNLGSIAGIPVAHLTGYAVRRGGATWDFQQHFQISRSMMLGRWSNEKTARIYIDQAMAHQAEYMLTEKTLKVLGAGQVVANTLLQFSSDVAVTLLVQLGDRRT